MSDKYFEDEIFDLVADDSLLSGEFINCLFKSIDFSGKSFRNSKFIECVFQKCNISNVDFVGSVFSDIKFGGSKLVGIDWSSCTSVRELNFSDCKLDFSLFNNLNIPNMIFEKCSLVDVDFSRSNLQNSLFGQSDLLRASFHGSDLRKADFRLAVNYCIDPLFSKLSKAKFSLPEAISLLQVMGVEIE